MIKDLVDYEGYAVTPTGEVYSYKTRRYMKPHPDHKGYMIVCLTINRKKISQKVHRLVAKTFIPNPDNLPQVNHKNGDKSDNSVENLEWCDGSYNLKHAYEHLGRKSVGGGGGKTPVVCIDTGEEFVSISEAARKTGIQAANISRTCKGRTEHAGGLKWQYKEGGRCYASNS